MFLYNIVWIKSAMTARHELGTVSGAIGFWDEAAKRWQTSLPFVYLTARNVALDHAGYTILDCMADTLAATPCMHRAASQPEHYPAVRVEVLYSRLIETFLGEEQLKNKKKRTPRNLIVNHAKSVRNQDDLDAGIGRYSLKKKLLNDHMESVELAKYGEACVVMNVWMGWIEAWLGLEK